MANTRRVRILRTVGHPSTGAQIKAGAIIEISDVWAKRFISQGAAEGIVETVEPKPPKSSKKKK